MLILDFLPENLRAAAVSSAPDAAVLDVALLTTNLLRADESDTYLRVCMEIDRVVIETVLRHAKGSQVQASERLGISRTTLRAKMCLSIQARIPEHLTAIRDALRGQNALHLRKATQKCCGLLSEFSTVAGDLASNRDDLVAGARFDKAPPILEQLERIARNFSGRRRAYPSRLCAAKQRLRRTPPDSRSLRQRAKMPRLHALSLRALVSKKEWPR
jgi:hypothetical protein